ncbi:putative reverse transcriptase domain-containing protein [Tanacetum coccineum]
MSLTYLKGLPAGALIFGQDLTQTWVKMDDPNITMEVYIRLEEEKARRRGKVYTWETATYGNICGLFCAAAMEKSIRGSCDQHGAKNDSRTIKKRSAIASSKLGTARVEKHVRDSDTDTSPVNQFYMISVSPVLFACYSKFDNMTVRKLQLLNQFHSSQTLETDYADLKDIVFQPYALSCGHIFYKSCACLAARVLIFDGFKYASPGSNCPVCRESGVYAKSVCMTEIAEDQSSGSEKVITMAEVEPLVKDFASRWKAAEYDGKGVAVVLTRWIKKMKYVHDMSGCSVNQKVKYAAGSFVEFCPSHEMQKLGSELWNHAMVGLAMLRILNKISGALTDEAVRNGSIKKVEKRRNVGEPCMDKNGRDDNNIGLGREH